MRHIIIAVLGCFGISYSPLIVAQVPAPNFDPVIGTLGQSRLLTVDLRTSFWSDPRTFRNGETNR